jgi:DNA-binding NarL/FixJ family response regulator
LPREAVSAGVIAIVSTLAIFREVLAKWLTDALPEYDVVDGLLAEVPEATRFKLVLITTSALGSPETDALLFSSRSNAQLAAPILLLGDPTDVQIRQVAATGRLRGILPEATPMKTLMSGVQFVMDGGSCFPNPINDLSRDIILDGPMGAAASTPLATTMPIALTKRERAVLECLSLGLPNKAIATKLTVAENTVKIHMRGLLKKLGAANRTEAVVIARSRGINVQL